MENKITEMGISKVKMPLVKRFSGKKAKCYAVKYRVLPWTGKWAEYVNRDVESQASFTVKALKCLPNKLTPLYSKIYYEEENYLKVKTELLIYPSPPHSKGLSILVY